MAIKITVKGSRRVRHSLTFEWFEDEFVDGDILGRVYDYIVLSNLVLRISCWIAGTTGSTRNVREYAPGIWDIVDIPE